MIFRNMDGASMKKILMYLIILFLKVKYLPLSVSEYSLKKLSKKLIFFTIEIKVKYLLI